jgi:hypothetical protein
MKATIRNLIIGVVMTGMAASQALADRRMEWRENDRSLKIEIKGEVSFTDNDAEVRELSPGGRFVLEKDDGDTVRRVEIRPSDDGSLRYMYSLDGRRAEWDARAKSWLAGALPEIIREAAIGVKDRVRRIRANAGPEGVINEISLIKSDGAKRAYLQELFDSGELEVSVLKSAAQRMGRINSDGDKSAVLIHGSKPYLSRAELLDDYFDAVNTIRSDGDHRRVLETAVKQPNGKDRAVELILRSAQEISSDGDKASVLMTAAGRLPEAERIAMAYVAAANTIRSDGDRRRVLAEFLKRERNSASVVIAALKSAGKISSDGDKSSVLSGSAQVLRGDESVLLAYVEAADTIRSDGDRDRALLALLERSDLSQAVLASARKNAMRKGDGERNRVIKRITELERKED